MLAFLKRLFVPTRFDACCLVIVFHWLTVLLTVMAVPIVRAHMGTYSLEPVVNVAGATWIAIAAAFWWRGSVPSRTWLLLASSVACTIYIYCWYWLNPQIFSELSETLNWGYSRRPQSDNRSFWALSWPLVRNACIAVAVLVFSPLFRWFARFLSKPFQAISGKFQNDRTRSLFVVAGILFALAVLSRIQSTLGIKVDFGNGQVIDFFVGSLISLVTWGVIFVWFPSSFSTNGK